MKSALLPVGAITAIVVFSTAVRRRSGLVALAALAPATAPLVWGLFLQQATGRFSIMSSYDGENFLRGWNSMASAVYPRVHLERLTDSRVIVTPDGERYTLTPFPAVKPVRPNEPGTMPAALRAWPGSRRIRARPLASYCARRRTISCRSCPPPARTRPFPHRSAGTTGCKE